MFCNGEEVLTVSGTKEKYVVDVWSGNHPFFKANPTFAVPSRLWMSVLHQGMAWLLSIDGFMYCLLPVLLETDHLSSILRLLRCLQGSGEQLILDEGRVNKFNKRFATIGAFGQVAPASVGGDKKLEYKGGKQDKGKGGKKR